MMVEYKGGSCVKCGYKKCIGALEFHHIDPSKKDFTLSHLKSSKFDDKIKNELDKCILVCANCHREIHEELTK
jgi:predicted HNH restriction endonuclease